MCGIAGKFSYDADGQIDRGTLKAMAATLAHRGPDAEGFYVGAGIGFAHRRLSIIDLVSGDEPLANEDRTIWVVFNGEIYNFKDLREQLRARGHVFRTESDTEVIVHGYEEWGPRVVERFRGMFAFALWDARRRRLVLARDRVGIKPLYYAPLASGLTFASEIKAILEDDEVSRDWQPEALDAYLALQYVPTPLTIYRDVWKLPPGHLLIAENSRAYLVPYWDLTFTGDGDDKREEEYLERLDDLLREAVRIRLISDVPLGAFLSGGIDSSAVVAYMVEVSDAPVLTTSVGFDEQGFSELASAQAVADHLGCHLSTRMVTPDIEDLLPRLAWHLDEPFADASAVPTYYVSAAAREQVTVALSGDGGDEMWAGYARHRVERWEARARAWLGSPGSQLASRIGQRLPLTVKGARSLRHLGLDPAEACARKHAYELFEPDTREQLLTADFRREVDNFDPYAHFRAFHAACPSLDPLDRAMYVDVKTYLLDDILVKVDKMSMAVGLETRVPLLDHKLIEFAATVPASLKLRAARTKHLLRRALERRVPRAILERPKHGFEAPTGEWLRGPLSQMVNDLLLGRRFAERGVFEPAAVRWMWDEHRLGLRDHRHRLWSLLMLELWFERFIDSARPRAEAYATATV
jgi:asparagine synthase (glutamine-hydrolysing)